MDPLQKQAGITPTRERGKVADEPKLQWPAVAGLGIAFAISGSFSGWNVGLGIGGWGGMLMAAGLMAGFYLCLTQCVAELAAACPHAEGMDSFAGLAPGDAGRYFAGMSIAIALGVAVGTGTSFIEAYAQSLFGIGGLPLKIALIAAFVGIQLRGAREAVSLTMIGGLIAAAALAVFCAGMAPAFSMAALYSRVDGTPSLLPQGILGALQCIPYALFMFLGVEQAANAAGEMREPMRDLPKAICTAVATILLLGFAVLVFSAAGGVDRLAAAEGDPLYVAAAGAQASGAGWLGTAVGLGSIVSLLATVFSLTYVSSRQFHSLAKSGFLPRPFADLNANGAPPLALWLVAALAGVGCVVDTDTVLVCFIFGLNVCNVLVLVSFLRARTHLPQLARPYRAIGGRLSGAVALALAMAVLAACARLQPIALCYVAIAYVVAAAHFGFRRARTHRLSLTGNRSE